MPLTKGKHKLIAGIIDYPKSFRCEQSGSLLITWMDGFQTIEEFVTGEVKDTDNVVQSVEIKDGMFSFPCVNSAVNIIEQYSNNGNFETGIDGYELRGNSTIEWSSDGGNPGGALLCNIISYGGGFIASMTPAPISGITYTVSIDIKDISYGGGFKFRLGVVEVTFVETITTEWVTYTMDITANDYSPVVEMLRSGTETGQVLFDNFSITTQ